MQHLVQHLHTFAKDVGLTSEEWMYVEMTSSFSIADRRHARRDSIHFLTQVGKTCTDIRQEFILLSDIFGLSALVDSMNHPTPAESNATEATILGPFFTEDAELVGSQNLTITP
jgi:hypothetical protein